MKRKRFSEEQIVCALAQKSTGQTIAEICRRLGVSEQTFYRWKNKFGSMGVMEVRRMKQLEEENSKLKWMRADLSLDKAILTDVLPLRSRITSVRDQGNVGVEGALGPAVPRSRARKRTTRRAFLAHYAPSPRSPWDTAR